MKAAVNTIIQWDEDSMERVLWIDDSQEYCAVIPLDEDSFPILRRVDEIENALDDGVAVKRPVDPYAYINALGEKYIEKHSKKRDKAWERIKDIVVLEPDIFNEKARNQLFTAAAEKFKCSKTTLYRDVKRYWKRGKVKNALLPNYFKSGGAGKERSITDEKKERNPEVGVVKRGRPRKDGLKVENVDEKTRIALQKGYQKYYASGEIKQLKKAFEKTMAEFFSMGSRNENGIYEPIHPNVLPTITQFKYWGEKSVKRKEVILKRVGKREFNLKNRAKPGTSTVLAKGPGEVYEIDSTIAPFHLVHRTRRNENIGKPTVYFAVDLFSRRCCGLHVSIHRASADQLRMLLFNTFTDKQEFCRRYGVEISVEDWDSGYVPHLILTDRGEYKGKFLDDIGDQMGFGSSMVAPFRGDLKAVIEYKMYQFLERFKELPGATKKGLRERGEEFPDEHAVLDIVQFTQG